MTETLLDAASTGYRCNAASCYSVAATPCPYLQRILAVEVTTTFRAIPQEVALGRREGLPKPCVANLDATRTIAVSCLTTRIGTLTARRHVDIKRALGHVLHWPELTSL